MDKSNTYIMFTGNISFFIYKRTLSDETFFEFFYILAVEEIDKLMENVKRYNRRKRV